MTDLNARFEDLNWVYPNEEDARMAFDEAFVGGEYSFRSSSDSPFVVDCGAHIGASVLYFKSLFPRSSIVAFEPNPELFPYLVENVRRNALSSVDVREIALSDVDGEELLFGSFDGIQSTLGNSTMRAWGDRPRAKKKLVVARRLSALLSRPVEFLKLNIEGAEFAVLRDLLVTGAIARVDQLYVQFHLCTQGNSWSDLQGTKEALEAAGFSVALEEKEVLRYLPSDLGAWASARQPRIIAARATRREGVM